MTKLILWKDREMSKMRRDIDTLFNRFGTDFGITSFPSEFIGRSFINITETENDIIVKAEITEIKPEDIKIKALHDSLIISGRKKNEIHESNKHYHKVETRVGSFSRTVRLPCDVDVENVKASYEKGILKIRLPKRKQDRAHDIEIEIK